MKQAGGGLAACCQPAANAYDRLASAQNADGGWPYRAGPSWTEPTVYAVLALGSRPEAAAARERGFAWLRAQQRHDGGWPPQGRVAESTWVTSLIPLLPVGWLAAADLSRAIGWMLAQTGRESDRFYRLRQKLLGNEPGDAREVGWPWFPGTAAWVVPSALAMLALRKVRRYAPGPEIARRIEFGQRFLLSRTCADGGWNHGSARSLGFESSSYAETTGLALLAIHGVPSARVANSVAAAERHLRDCRSAEAASWLQIALMAHGRRPRPVSVTARNWRDTALMLLAEQALQETNAFLD